MCISASSNPPHPQAVVSSIDAINLVFCPAKEDSESMIEKSSITVSKQQQQQQQLSSKSRFIVQHNYHDHANENLDQLTGDSSSRNLAYYHHQQQQHGATTFLLKLHEMLDRVEDDGYANIISWQPHGRCFVIHKPKAFREILPKYFKLSKVASFQRQLNLYGFTRLTGGRDKGGYYHELFLRGKQFLANKIHRIKIKGTGVRAKANPHAEPNLWEMDWVGCCKSNTPSLRLQGGGNETKIKRIEDNDSVTGICSFEGKQFYYVDQVEILGRELVRHRNHLSMGKFGNFMLEIDDIFEEFKNVGGTNNSDGSLANLLDCVVSSHI